jgi:hypothetical protein
MEDYTKRKLFRYLVKIGILIPLIMLLWLLYIGVWNIRRMSIFRSQVDLSDITFLDCPHETTDEILVIDGTTELTDDNTRNLTILAES